MTVFSGGKNMKKGFSALLALVMIMGLLAGCGSKEEETVKKEESKEGIDYMVLVNKLNPLPDDWEDKVETVHMTNTVGDDVEVEKKAYDAYLKLKEDLEKEDVHVDLDSARRTVEAQQEIWDDFTEQYGEAYTKKTVAQPGYSEHHTGLALDLYLIIDGKDVVENEDMIQYPEIWEKIHAKLADYGFILRYLKGKEHITGYGYEPWHIRYVDDPAIAKEITDKGDTLEVYLGAVKDTDPEIDYGKSELYTEEELDEAMVQVKCQFASWEGCELEALRYAGDEFNTEENIKWLNESAEDKTYSKVIKITSDFHTPKSGYGSFEKDYDYLDYEWWLGCDEEGSWDIVQMGYN